MFVWRISGLLSTLAVLGRSWGRRDLNNGHVYPYMVIFRVVLLVGAQLALLLPFVELGFCCFSGGLSVANHHHRMTAVHILLIQ